MSACLLAHVLGSVFDSKQAVDDQWSCWLMIDELMEFVTNENAKFGSYVLFVLFSFLCLSIICEKNSILQGIPRKPRALCCQIDFSNKQQCLCCLQSTALSNKSGETHHMFKYSRHIFVRPGSLTIIYFSDTALLH